MKHTFYLIITLLLITQPSQAAYPDIQVEKLISVYDGDTFKIDIANCPLIIFQNIAVRINGLDTPEIRTKCIGGKNLAKQARGVLKNLLQNAQLITLKNPKRGKYFRIIADVFADQIRVSDVLINQGLGRPYAGGKRRSWC